MWWTTEVSTVWGFIFVFKQAYAGLYQIVLFLRIIIIINNNTISFLAGSLYNKSSFQVNTMQPSYGITFIFLFAIKPFVFSYAAPTNATANVTTEREMSSQTASTPLMSTTEATNLSSAFTMVSNDGINNSATNFKRNSTSSATFTIPGDFSRVTTNSAANSTGLPPTLTPSNSTVTKGTHSAAALPSYTSSINPTTFPTSIALTSPTVKQDSPTTNFNTSQHTTELNSTMNSAEFYTSSISSNPEGTNEGKHLTKVA